MCHSGARSGPRLPQRLAALTAVGSIALDCREPPAPTFGATRRVWGKRPCPLASRLPWWLRWQRIHLRCRRPGLNPWVGKSPWQRVWQPTPVFLPGESPWTEEPGGLQSMGSQRAGHHWTTKHSLAFTSGNAIESFLFRAPFGDG